MLKPKRVIAAFDFDETLITRDTLPDFLYSSFSPLRFTSGALRSLLILLLFVLKRIGNQEAKERLLTIFLKGMSVDCFDKLCEKYIKRLDKLADPDALKRVAWHQDQKHEVVIVSASPRNWIVPWAKNNGIGKVISTELEVIDEHLTGKLSTPNCHGPEKVRRFMALYPDRENYTLYVYGDGKSDQAMFDLADHVFVKTFNDQGSAV